MKMTRSYLRKRKKRNFQRPPPKETDHVQDQDLDHPGRDQGPDLVPGLVQGPVQDRDQSQVRVPDLGPDPNQGQDPVPDRSLDHARVHDHAPGRGPGQARGQDQDLRHQGKVPDQGREVLRDLSDQADQGLDQDPGQGVGLRPQCDLEVVHDQDPRPPTAPDRGRHRGQVLQLAQVAGRISGPIKPSEFISIFFINIQ